MKTQFTKCSFFSRRRELPNEKKRLTSLNISGTYQGCTSPWLYTSKLRYSLQLLGKVRTIDEDSANGLLANLQVTQNKLVRFLNGSTLLDKVCNKEIYKNVNSISVNQLNCQIKLKEVWKSNNDVN